MRPVISIQQMQVVLETSGRTGEGARTVMKSCVSGAGYYVEPVILAGVAHETRISPEKIVGRSRTR